MRREVSFMKSALLELMLRSRYNVIANIAASTYPRYISNKVMQLFMEVCVPPEMPLNSITFGYNRKGADRMW